MVVWMYLLWIPWLMCTQSELWLIIHPTTTEWMTITIILSSTAKGTWISSDMKSRMITCSTVVSQTIVSISIQLILTITTTTITTHLTTRQNSTLSKPSLISSIPLVEHHILQITCIIRLSNVLTITTVMISWLLQSKTGTPWLVLINTTIHTMMITSTSTWKFDTKLDL